MFITCICTIFNFQENSIGMCSVYNTSIREKVEELWVDPASSLVTRIWRTSTLHMIQSCVTVRLGISCVIEFLHGGTPLFALRYCPYRLLNRTCIPSSDIGSHSADESNFPGRVWSTLFHKQTLIWDTYGFFSKKHFHVWNFSSATFIESNCL